MSASWQAGAYARALPAVRPTASHLIIPGRLRPGPAARASFLTGFRGGSMRTALVITALGGALALPGSFVASAHAQAPAADHPNIDGAWVLNRDMGDQMQRGGGGVKSGDGGGGGGHRHGGGGGGYGVSAMGHGGGGMGGGGQMSDEQKQEMERRRALMKELLQPSDSHECHRRERHRHVHRVGWPRAEVQDRRQEGKAPVRQRHGRDEVEVGQQRSGDRDRPSERHEADADLHHRGGREAAVGARDEDGRRRGRRDGPRRRPATAASASRSCTTTTTRKTCQ